MKHRFAVILATLIVLLVWVAPATAKVELNVAMTLKLNDAPRDAVMSLNGKWIYVLTEKNEILIFTSTGRHRDTISLDARVESIEAGPREDVLVLTREKEKTVQIVTLDLIQDINISGSPFEGKADAPVVIATFNDFE